MGFRLGPINRSFIIIGGGCEKEEGDDGGRKEDGQTRYKQVEWENWQRGIYWNKIKFILIFVVLDVAIKMK